MKFSKCLLPTVSRDSPCGCPLSAIAGTTILICLYIVDSLPSRPTIIKRYILPAFRRFFSVWEKKRLQRKGRLGVSPRDPANAAPQYLVRGSQSAARHIRTQTRRSLNECVLVRLATQAVPSPPLSWRIKHCGAAIESLIIRIGWVTCFYFAMA